MVTIKIQKKSGYMEKVLPSVGLAAGFLENLAERNPEYWTAKVYVEDTFFYQTNKFLMNPKTEVLPAVFKFKNENDDEIKLEIKENGNDYVVINAWLNGKQIANNSNAFVQSYKGREDRAYLEFVNVQTGKTTAMCICDLRKEYENSTPEFIKDNRKISNLLFELGKSNDVLFPFSMYTIGD